MKKKIKKIIKQVPPGYYQNLNIFQILWHNGKYQAVKNLIAGRKVSKVLDLGCNDGTMMAKIVSLLPEVKSAMGIDLSSSAIEFARKKYPRYKFEVGDILKLRFSEKFDLIICLETIEHVDDPEKLISEIKRLLSSDGIAIVEMDSGNWLFKTVWYFWRKMGGRVWNGAHLWHTNKEGLLHLLRESELKIEKIVSFNLGMGVALKLKLDKDE